MKEISDGSMTRRSDKSNGSLKAIGNGDLEVEVKQKSRNDSNFNHHRNDDDIQDDGGLNDHNTFDDHHHHLNDIEYKSTEEDDEFEQLLPPKPNYNRDDDEDLDELMGIELNPIGKKKNDDTFKTNDNDQEMKMNSKQQHQETKWCVRKYGNMIILNTTCYNAINKRYGMIGPHWLGPVFTFGLLAGASYYFTNKALDLGSGSVGTCVGFTIFCTYNFLRIICVDPGIVKHEEQLIRRKKKHIQGEDDKSDDGKHDVGKIDTKNSEYETILRGEEEGWRYCAICQVYQPPDAMHCPITGVCIDGYDHYCPWMGTCIGKNNMSAFMCFNCTWLIYLGYCCLWVVGLGPVFAKKAMADVGDG